MAFFPRSFYNTEASFTPLFRLLDDFDSYSRQNGSCNAVSTTKKSYLPSWQPKFDVREVEDAYELHGELPGVARENVHIEFSDPQTMLIRGKVERNYTSGTPVDNEDDASVTNGDAASIIDGDAASTDSKRNSRQATVADEEETEAQENGAPTQEVAARSESAPADTAKYWLTERSIGEFSRSFNFPSRVEQDDVTASFRDGVLSISVPKAKKHESRRIAIN